MKGNETRSQLFIPILVLMIFQSFMLLVPVNQVGEVILEHRPRHGARVETAAEPAPSCPAAAAPAERAASNPPAAAAAAAAAEPAASHPPAAAAIPPTDDRPDRCCPAVGGALEQHPWFIVPTAIAGSGKLHPAPLAIFLQSFPRIASERTFFSRYPVWKIGKKNYTPVPEACKMSNMTFSVCPPLRLRGQERAYSAMRSRLECN